MKYDIIMTVLYSLWRSADFESDLERDLPTIYYSFKMGTFRSISGIDIDILYNYYMNWTKEKEVKYHVTNEELL